MSFTQNADGSYTFDRSPGRPPVTISQAQYETWLGAWGRFWGLILDPALAPKVLFNAPVISASDPANGGKTIPGTTTSWKNPA